MRFPPPEVMASWPHPNYENPVLRKPYLLPINSILIGIAVIMTLLRIYARFFHTHTAATEDWLVIVALIPAIGLTVTVSLAGSRYGWNMHIWDFKATYANLIHERSISWASQMLYIWSSSLTKLSFLVFYRRIFQTRTMKLVTLACIYFTGIYFVACFLTLIFECRPLSLYWHILVLPQGTGGSCIDEGYPLLGAGVVNVIIDMAILVLPVHNVLSLNINWKQKLQLLAIFTAGAFVVASSIIRVSITWTIIRETYDVTWYGYLVWMWVGIEVDVGLICASIPACNSLVKSWRLRTKHGRPMSHTHEQRRELGHENLTSINTVSFKGRYVLSYAGGHEEITLDHVDHPANWMGGSMHCAASQSYGLVISGGGHGGV